jgi:GT2 family glycosyltransferase
MLPKNAPLRRLTRPLSRKWKDFVRFRYESGRNGIFYGLDRPSRRQPAHFVQNPLVISGWALDVAHRTAPRVRIMVAGRTYRPEPKSREDVQRAFEATAALPGACGFEEIIDLPIGMHRLKVEIDTGEGAWLLLYSALVFNLPFHRRPQAVTSSYQRWAKVEQALLAEEMPELRKHCALMLRKPKFSIIVEVTDPAGFRATEDSLRRQIYPHWAIHALVPDGATALRGTAASAGKVIHDISAPDVDGDFLVFMCAGDELAVNALYEFASALNVDPGLDLIYADESHTAGRRRRVEPFIKPDWSPDYLETFNYIGHPACYRADIARACATKEGYYDFVLRFTERSDKIHHVRRVLLRRPAGHGSVDRVRRNSDIAALNNRLRRTARTGTVTAGEGGYYELALTLKERPLVSIIIPTAGKTVKFEGREIDLVMNCVSQLFDRSTYDNKEVIIVDNGNLAPAKRRALEELGCRLITFDEPQLNIPRKLNLGASVARGSMLLLLNDDIEEMAPDWIERMLEQFEKKHVGVVGAKLLYPNGLLQHAGVAHNKGNPSHVRRLYPRNDSGYFFSTCGVRNFMAVTGACMMTPREVYRRVGGYSDELPVSYNDVDYCMKVGELGLYTVYAPRAEMVHLESQSRVASSDAREVDWYQRRWARAVASDPFYNERHLTVGSPTFEPCANRRLI